MALFGFPWWRSRRPADERSQLEATLTRLGQLEERLGHLERREADRELVITEATGKWLRYLKRVQELDRREGPDQDVSTLLTRQLLATKFPNGRNG